jgi:quinol monooxygenase YgiN
VIVGTIRILPPRNRRADVLGVLLSVQGPIRAKPGCSACDIYEERSPEHAILFVERWISDAALEMHVRSEVYRRVLTVMELCAGPPDIRFEHVSFAEGMELIERLRR